MNKSGEKTRKSILRAASSIVQEKGVEQLTLEEIARVAGISKGGLLYHFPNKDALIAGMIHDYLGRFQTDFVAAHDVQEEGQQGRWTSSYLHTTFEDRERVPRMSSGLLAAAAINPALLAPMQEEYRAWVDLLENDGIDPIIATIVRLAADGICMVELFGLAEPDHALREKVLKVLEVLITLPPEQLKLGTA